MAFSLLSTGVSSLQSSPISYIRHARVYVDDVEVVVLEASEGISSSVWGFSSLLFLSLAFLAFVMFSDFLQRPADFFGISLGVGKTKKAQQNSRISLSWRLAQL